MTKIAPTVGVAGGQQATVGGEGGAPLAVEDVVAGAVGVAILERRTRQRVLGVVLGALFGQVRASHGHVGQVRRVRCVRLAARAANKNFQCSKHSFFYTYSQADGS